ncbi:MAG TPA: hypothetical protein VMV18_07390 [bacterium]|nr:hypothetical protein [bacterium]
MRARPLLFALFVAALFARDVRGADAPPAPPSPPVDLADRFAASMLAAAKRANARAVRVDLAGEEDLAGAPALAVISHELDSALYGPGKLTPAGGAAPADLEIVARLSRARGRVVLGGAVTAHGATVDWALASSEERPEWWPWLSAPVSAPPIAPGLSWRRVGSIPQNVEDADAGDLDGDGLVEFAVATASELLVFRMGATGPESIATVPFDDGPQPDSAEIATRAPRTFVRVVSTPGGPGEVLVRRSDERRTRVYAWEAGHLARRADREGLVLAERETARGRDVVTAELAPGTNRFDAPPQPRRAGGATAKPLPDVRWIEFRPASLSAAAVATEGGPFYGMVDANGILYVLGADFSSPLQIGHTGTAFALADLDGDGKVDVLSSYDVRGSGGSREHLSLFLAKDHGDAAFSQPLDYDITAIAAGTGTAGPAALVFLAAPDGTDVWMLKGAR